MPIETKNPPSDNRTVAISSGMPAAMPSDAPLAVSPDTPSQLAQSVFRSMFAIRPEDGTLTKMVRPAGLAIILSSVGVCFNLPLTNIKTAIMTSHEDLTIRTATRALWNVPPQGTKSIWHTRIATMYAGFPQEISREIVRQFPRGFFVGPFPIYLKGTLPKEYHQAIPFISAFLLACSETTLSTPFETRRQYLNSVALATGPKEPYRPFMGYKETMGRQVPAWMIALYLAPHFRELAHSINGDRLPSVVGFAAAGLPFSFSFIVPLHFMDTAKVQKQQAGTSKYGILPSDSIPQTLQKVYHHGAKDGGGVVGGLRTAWKGCVISGGQRWVSATIILLVGEIYSKWSEDKSPIQPIDEAMSNFGNYVLATTRRSNSTGAGRS